MRFVNHTRFPAVLFRACIDDDRLAASVLARVTYDIAGGKLVPAAEQRWKASLGPWESEHGSMDGDEVFYKGGVDLFLFGHARAPGGHETTRMEVGIEVGSFRRQVVVFGDRVWRKGERGLAPSAPLPFKAIPLTLSRAYGGKDRWDGLDVPFPDNPDGRGFSMNEADAEGRSLPNLEDPDCLVVKWDDRPDPVGLGPCPPWGGPRLKNGLEFDEHGMLTKLRPAFYNAAFPRMIVDRVQPGDRVRIDGVSESGPISFSIPDQDFTVRLTIGEKAIEARPAIDQVGIEADHGRAFIAYRYPFRYVVRPLDRRSCELLGGEA